MKKFTQHEMAFGIVGIGLAALVIVLVIQSDGFNQAEASVGTSLGSSIGEALEIGLLLLIIGAIIVLIV